MHARVRVLILHCRLHRSGVAPEYVLLQMTQCVYISEKRRFKPNAKRYK